MTARKPARTSRPRTATAVTHSTLWACGPTPIEVADSWPPRVLARSLLEYSAPDDRVLLMPRTPAAERLVGDFGRILAPAPGQTQLADTDLIIAATLPGTPGLRPWMVADVAASRLRAGGLLVVLTRSHHDHDGVFHNLTGDLVTAAQNTDLLYLQHLVAAPIHDDEIVPTPAHPGPAESPAGSGDPGDPGETGPAEVAATEPVHIDVLVFLQPHDLTATA
ncbi:hypothetical protein [Nocardia blacklockiae]|uniref:hypothetical protein n=1 Tax=Nocardia blacklockiae TaxID=480036 RepID=UPI001894B8F2|nr:hypothetical protein [Nocardia blacklockiae]MBF6175204.1 hypothetical protein [Nocardia blacklockiae]